MTFLFKVFNTFCHTITFPTIISAPVLGWAPIRSGPHASATDDIIVVASRFAPPRVVTHRPSLPRRAADRVLAGVRAEVALGHRRATAGPRALGLLQRRAQPGLPAAQDLKSWHPDGIIARLAGDRLFRQVRAMGLPTVDLYREDEHPRHSRHLRPITRRSWPWRSIISWNADSGTSPIAAFPAVAFPTCGPRCFQQALASAGSARNSAAGNCLRHRAGQGRAVYMHAAYRRTGELARTACPSRWPCWPATTCAGSR